MKSAYLEHLKRIKERADNITLDLEPTLNPDYCPVVKQPCIQTKCNNYGWDDSGEFCIYFKQYIKTGDKWNYDK